MRFASAVSGLFLGVVLSCTVSTYADTGKTYRPQSVEVYFSPKGGATEAVVSVIGSAQESINVQAYSFTSAPIAKDKDPVPPWRWRKAEKQKPQ